MFIDMGRLSFCIKYFYTRYGFQIKKVKPIKTPASTFDDLTNYALLIFSIIPKASPIKPEPIQFFNYSFTPSYTALSSGAIAESLF